MSSVIRVTTASLAVLGTAGLATYLAVGVNVRSTWNLLWIVGLPLLATAVFFRRSSRWVWPAAFLWLTVCSFCTLSVTAQMLGAG